MPFWLHEKPLKTRLRVISLRERFLLSSLALVMITSALYFYLIKPKKDFLTHQQDVLKTLQKKQTALASVQAEYDALQVSCDALKKECNDYNACTFTQQQIVDQLFGLIKQSKLTCQTFTPVGSAATLVLNGSYHHLSTLFALMSSSNASYVITKLDVEPYKDRLLRINLSINMSEV